MTDADDIEMLAAEYVLGTLDAAERAAVAQRRVGERQLDSAILEWQALLAPLDEASHPVMPQASIKDAVMARIADAGGRSPAPDNVVLLTRRANRWRSAAVGASALAASLAGLAVYQATLQQPPASSPAATSYVAVLQKDAQSPAFLMTVDIAQRTLTVRPVAAERQSGKSYELWIINDKLGAPRSLGVVGDRPFSQGPTLAAYAPAVIEQAVYAVTLEPEGGSKSGAPTGPVLFSGKLVQSRP